MTRRSSVPCHLYLSPHLDDVVLGCGGLVREQTRAGARVVIASLCTASPAPEQPLGALAERLHASWGNPRSPYTDRRREDEQACARLGAEHRHLGLLDAIYRRDAASGVEYRTTDELFGPIAVWDGDFQHVAVAAIARLLEQNAPDAVYGPLGTGAHVDHVHVLRALWELRDFMTAPLWLYEEQPYAAGIYPVKHLDAVADAVRACPFELEPAVHACDFAAKKAAIHCYRSQLAELFGADLAGMAVLEAYARSLGTAGEPAERLWRACAD